MSQDNNWQQQVWQQSASSQPQQQVSAPVVASAVPCGNPAQHPSAKSHGWIVALAVVVALFGVVALGMWSCTSIVSADLGSLGSLSTPVDIEDLSGDAIALIDIDGTIQYDATTSSPEGLSAQLERAKESEHIKAVVLRVNSGGGTATAGEEMAEYVRRFSEDSGKPVVVSSASINASAAYEISSQADYIYTAKTTAIGAIGTAMQVTDLSGLMEKLGISVDNVTSAESKDSSYGTRPLTEEERAYYQDQVDQINETFIQLVAEGRNMDVEDVRSLATGLTFTGMTAVENGLADEIGTKEDAVAKAAELANVTHYTTVSLEESSGSLSGLLDLMSENRISADDIAQALKELGNDDGIAR